jgi:hypothetical protein
MLRVMVEGQDLQDVQHKANELSEEIQRIAMSLPMNNSVV